MLQPLKDELGGEVGTLFTLFSLGTPIQIIRDV